MVDIFAQCAWLLACVLIVWFLGAIDEDCTGGSCCGVALLLVQSAARGVVLVNCILNAIFYTQCARTQDRPASALQAASHPRGKNRPLKPGTFVRTREDGMLEWNATPPTLLAALFLGTVRACFDCSSASHTGLGRPASWLQRSRVDCKSTNEGLRSYDLPKQHIRPLSAPGALFSPPPFLACPHSAEREPNASETAPR